MPHPLKYPNPNASKQIIRPSNRASKSLRRRSGPDLYTNEPYPLESIRSQTQEKAEKDKLQMSQTIKSMSSL